MGVSSAVIGSGVHTFRGHGKVDKAGGIPK